MPYSPFFPSRVLISTVTTSLLAIVACPAFALGTADSMHVATPADKAAIMAVLHTYTEAVTNKDEKAFEGQLLGEDIPFTFVGSDAQTKKALSSETSRNYASFRDSIFRSPAHFTQRFDHIRIEQDGNLAAVTLDFETRQVGQPGATAGFKVLHLLKVQGDWKIASEFFTGRNVK